MLYGDPTLAIRIDDDHTDRIGIRTLVLSQFWQPSAWPLTDAQYDEQEPEIPVTNGGMILIGQQTRPNGGGLRTSWTFEGVNGDGKSVTFKTRSNTLDYGFDPGFAQVSIIGHPLISQLLQQYDGQVLNGEVFWAQYLSSGSSGIGLAGNSNSGQTPNPMYGVEDFFRLEGNYYCRYASFDLVTAMAGIGTIFDSSALPGLAPTFKDGRNWLKAPSPWKKKGIVNDITELYWLSGPGGWPAPVYPSANGGNVTPAGSGGPLGS